MDTKEKVLESYESFRCTDGGLDETHYYKDNVLLAMDAHARNCMIEVLRRYMNDSFDQKHADKYVDRFLQSDTFKELQK